MRELSVHQMNLEIASDLGLSEAETREVAGYTFQQMGLYSRARQRGESHEQARAQAESP